MFLQNNLTLERVNLSLSIASETSRETPTSLSNNLIHNGEPQQQRELPSHAGSSDAGADNLAAFLAQLALDPNYDVATAHLTAYLATLSDESDEPVPDAAEEQQAAEDWAEGAALETEFGAEFSFSSSVQPRTPGTYDEVKRVWVDVFNHLDPEERESLRQSPAPIIRFLEGPTFEAYTLDTSICENEKGWPARRLRRTRSPRGRSRLEVASPELLLNLYRYLSPMDELLLGYTHPAIFHTDRFSLYYSDIDYQLHWQQGNPALANDEPRLPLLHLAITNGAPMLVIRDILQTWQNRGLDFDLNWANAGRTRHSALFKKPMFLAAVCGRADVCEELLARGDGAAELTKGILLAPFQLWSQRNLSDQAWEDLETLALGQPAVLSTFLGWRPLQAQAKRLYKACVMAGWIRLLSFFLEPMLSLGNNVSRRRRMHVYRLLTVEVRDWVNVVGHVRVDNTGMINYIFRAWEKIIAITQVPNSLYRWHGVRR
ncbi:hypothetical protein PG988_011601 [Apiospora saccharicola]